MPKETFAKRFLKVMSDNGLKQKQIEQFTGISQASISDINTGKVVKKYENIDIMFDLCKTDDQKFYVATGKHLPQDSTQHTPDAQQQIYNVVRQLLEEVQELRQEIKLLREEKKSSQVRHRQKVPEAH